MAKNGQLEKRINDGLDFVDQIINMLYQEVENQSENPQATKKIICKNLRYSYEIIDNTIYFYLPGHNNKTIAKWIDPETRILTIAKKDEENKEEIFRIQIDKKYDLHSVTSEFKDGVLKVSFEEYAGKEETIEF